MSGWYGFRTVARGAKVWHGFRRPGGRSLCGSVRFGPRYPTAPNGRACRTCAAIWKRKHPPRDSGSAGLFARSVAR